MREHLAHQLVRVERLELGLAALEQRAQPPDHLARALVGGDDVLQDLREDLRLGGLVGEEVLRRLRVAEDRGERLVQLVGDAAGELAQHRHARKMRELQALLARLELDPGALLERHGEQQQRHRDRDEEKLHFERGLLRRAAGERPEAVHRAPDRRHRHHRERARGARAARSAPPPRAGRAAARRTAPARCARSNCGRSNTTTQASEQAGEQRGGLGVARARAAARSRETRPPPRSRISGTMVSSASTLEKKRVRTRSQ